MADTITAFSTENEIRAAIERDSLLWATTHGHAGIVGLIACESRS